VRGRILAAVALSVLGATLVAAAASAGVGGPTTLGSARPAPGVRTIPFFTDSFAFGGVTYPYSMVGTNPRTSRATTSVGVVIVPLRLVFADGNVSDPGPAVGDVLRSPLFVDAPFSSGTTQYGDAIRRAMFWQYVGGTGYHLLLRRPLVLPTLTLRVPAADGVFVHAGDPIGPPVLGFHAAVDTGVVSDTWFFGLFDSILALAPDPTMLPIVLGRNVALSGDPIPYGAPTLGFHSAASVPMRGGGTAIQTGIFATYGDPNPIVELPGLLRNTDVLSHEVSEWMHDPFLSNTVPTWISPLPLASLVYGCQSLLETGDPMADVAFDVNGYQLSDEAFLSWFAHQTPSPGIDGQYSYTGAVTGPSPLC
jgi:hypothetical protein